MFLDSEVDGHRLTPEDVIDIGYLFFLAGLDTVTASLDCMLAYLAQHPEQRQQLVDDPSLIPHAVEEMLRWETPVQGVIRITTAGHRAQRLPDPEGQAGVGAARARPTPTSARGSGPTRSTSTAR